MDTRPNLFLLVSAGHGAAATGCYGNASAATPNLDRFASEGARFTNAYTNCPLERPARTCLLTGRHVRQLGAASAPPVDSLLAAADYATLMCGRDDDGPGPGDVERAEGFLREQAQGAPGKPWLLYLGTPASPGEQATDKLAGRLLGLINESPLRRTTVAIYTSTNGQPTGPADCFGEAAVRVPLLMRRPCEVNGLRVRHNVSLVDIAPTLLEFAGVRPPAEMAGRSLAGCPGAHGLAERSVLCQRRADGMVRRGDLKYVHYADQTPSLFDLAADPEERQDLASDPSYRQVRDELQAELARLAQASS